MRLKCIQSDLQMLGAILYIAGSRLLNGTGVASGLSGAILAHSRSSKSFTGTRSVGVCSHSQVSDAR